MGCTVPSGDPIGLQINQAVDILKHINLAISFLQGKSDNPEYDVMFFYYLLELEVMIK